MSPASPTYDRTLDVACELAATSFARRHARDPEAAVAWVNDPDSSFASSFLRFIAVESERAEVRRRVLATAQRRTP